ncbi:MAG: ABC transporter substrate-binding protein [Gammaproteobacteria bacterium]|nr:ABC transporter substrate-binding protein [Gammaproteobacteria bacterium]MDH3448346.1 ABC transporter substrate-binding protein [Gammaproteobacteria bacterium]
MKFFCFLLLTILGLAPLASDAAPDRFIETPSLAAQVASSELPPVQARLPQQSKLVVLDGERQAGFHGGQLRVLMGTQKDIRQIVVYGYARLVCYTPDLELEADILESYDVVDNRIFTLRLRRGHKWSDGHPFTSEDFRYYWEDVALNPELSRGGPNKLLIIDGELPRVEFPDKYTVRYSWSNPNPYFLTALAAALPLYIYKPAHYLRQFHARYQSEEKLAQMIEQFGKRNWMGVHVDHDRPYKATNPDLPTLQPWYNSTYPPSDRFIFKRNPYYHRVDQNGRQLPYIDSVAVNIASSKLVPAKTGAGEADLQARYLRMDNYTFLKSASKRNGFDVRLWQTAKGAHMALYPNLNTKDPVFRKLLQDVRFRRAMSLAINRYEINQVVYFRLVQASNNTVLEEGPLYKPEYQNDWIEFDLKTANRMLDELGLVERDDRGVRLLPDGRPLEILVQTAGESTEQTDVLELIHDSWLEAGIKLYSVPSTREVFRNRIFSGEAIMSIWSGLPNAIPTDETSPRDLAPTSKYQYQWPQWGAYYESSGSSGEPPSLPAARELVELNDQWAHAENRDQRIAVWHKMLEINRDQMFTIGIVNHVPTPVVVNNHLHNVPLKAFYDIEPGAYFGIYKPDTFWFDEARR